jgi:hypothetical protein
MGPVLSSGHSWPSPSRSRLHRRLDGDASSSIEQQDAERQPVHVNHRGRIPAARPMLDVVKTNIAVIRIAKTNNKALPY